MKQTEFHINGSELPANGRPLEFRKAPQWAESILNDKIFAVQGGVDFNGLVRRLGDNVVLSLSIQVPLSFSCCRCGQDTKLDYATRINHLFVRSQNNKIQVPLDIDLDAELDITEGVSNSFDAEPTVIGAFADALPLYPVCDEDCTVAIKATVEEPYTIDPRLAPLAEIRAALEPMVDAPATANKTI